MENKKSKDFFWPSYVDLMTSLFVIVLVLFVLSYVNFTKQNADFKKQNADLAANAMQMERIKQIDKALKQLDKKYFFLDPNNNRYKLLVNVVFAPHSSDISTLGSHSLNELKYAGSALYSKMKELSSDSDINYLLIIEGNTQKFNNNWVTNPNRGYITSYNRSLALKNYWLGLGYDFNQFQNCEILIVGSGYFGRSHQLNSRTFTIQITPKFKIENSIL